jgi:photosystem II stability/assembly factor-like uncharacterized protein
MKKILFLLILAVSLSGCRKNDKSNSSWTNLFYSNTITDLNSVYFTDDNAGYIAGYNETLIPYSVSAVILKTINGGDTWTATQIEKGGSLKSVYFPDVNIGYAVGEDGTILKTTTRGE